MDLAAIYSVVGTSNAILFGRELSDVPKTILGPATGTYALGERDLLIDDDPYYAQLGPDPETCQQRYREFVKMDGPYDKLVDQALVEAHF